MNDVVTAVKEFMKFNEVKAYIDAQTADIPNFWSIIEYGKNSYETRYSRMIRWLLDPMETHNQGNFFANKLIELSTLDGKKKLSAGGGHAKCEALGSNIDIFFIDEQEKITITIELKMWSSDHANNGEHQLDKYYDAVDAKYKPTDDYQNHYFYITINGDSPNVAMMEHREEWDNISYEQILSIIKLMKQKIMKDESKREDLKLSTLKIIGDFHEDMSRNVSKYEFITSDNIMTWNKNNLSLREKFKQLKNDYVDNRMTDPSIDEACKKFLANVNEGDEEEHRLTEEQLIFALELMSLSISEQNHKANEDVHRLMSEIFLNFAGNKDDAKTALSGETKRRKVKLKQNIISQTGFRYVWMTSGKGQGLRFFKEDMKEKEYGDAIKMPYVYFSGDYSQKIFNDGVAYSLENDNKPSGKISYTKLLKLFNKPKDKDAFLSKNITKEAGFKEFADFLIELLKNTQNFEEIIEQKRNDEKAKTNDFTEAISLINYEKQKRNKSEPK